jgi:hypothetical protein
MSWRVQQHYLLCIHVMLFPRQKCALQTHAPCMMVGQMGLDTSDTYETLVSIARDTEDEMCVRMIAYGPEYSWCRDTRDTDLLCLWCAGRTKLFLYGKCVYTAPPDGLSLSIVPAYDKRRGKSERGLRVRRRLTSSSRDCIASRYVARTPSSMRFLNWMSGSSPWSARHTGHSSDIINQCVIHAG